MELYKVGSHGQFGGLPELGKEPPVDWLIKGWLPGNELSCLYGKGGTFKSYIALGWTMQLAAHGHRTLYIAAEGSSGLRSRAEAWMVQRGLDNERLKGWNYYNSNLHIDTQGSRLSWIRGAQLYLEKRYSPPKRKRASTADDGERGEPGVDLVVVDTLARNFIGDENSPKEMGAFVEGCEDIRRELGTAVLVIHHTRKDGKGERGTESLRNATFAMYRTSDPRYTQSGGGSVVVECERMKDAPTPPAVRVRFDTVSIDIDRNGEVHKESQSMRHFPPKPPMQKVPESADKS